MRVNCAGITIFVSCNMEQKTDEVWRRAYIQNKSFFVDKELKSYNTESLLQTKLPSCFNK